MIIVDNHLVGEEESSANSFPIVGDVQSSCQVDSVLLKYMQFSRQLHLLNFIVLHLYKSETDVTFGKPNVNNSTVPKLCYVSFTVCYTRHFFCSF